MWETRTWIQDKKAVVDDLDGGDDSAGESDGAHGRSIPLNHLMSDAGGDQGHRSRSAPS